MSKVSPDALKALQAAQKEAVARYKKNAPPPEPTDAFDLDEAECLVRLVIHMYSSSIRLALGVMPDGMAVWGRVSVPKTSADPRAGHVAFVVGSDMPSVLQKAVAAMEAPTESKWWKPDRFATTTPD